MDYKIKKLWLEELRSSKYPQGTGTLYDGSNYCALGVLCSLHIQERNGKWVNTVPGRYYYYSWSAGLPPIVRDWAGLPQAFPKVQVNNERSTISKLNDSGYTFEEIADIIEEQL